jgi:hypothetical protein
VVSWYPEITELRRLQEVAEVLWELGDRAEEAAGRGESVILLPGGLDLPWGRASPANEAPDEDPGSR